MGSPFPTFLGLNSQQMGKPIGEYSPLQWGIGTENSG